MKYKMIQSTRKIAVIVVTYNRLDLLKKCIDALRNQTLKDFDIIVVNNGSTDGTGEWLSNQTDIDVVTQKNIGGSGGFHNGLKYAFKAGYDYYWIMDDDGIPEKNCLEKLYEVSQKGFHYVAPNLLTFENIPHFENINSSCEPIVNHVGGPFNAILLSKTLISQIGLPNIHYFIWGDEYEFTNRVKEKFFFTVLVKDAIHHHKLTEDNPKAVEKRIYYKLRNIIWSARLSKGIIESKKYRKFSAINSIVKYTFIYAKNFRIGALKDVFKAVLDGYQMNIDKLRAGAHIDYDSEKI